MASVVPYVAVDITDADATTDRDHATTADFILVAVSFISIITHIIVTIATTIDGVSVTDKEKAKPEYLASYIILCT